MGRLKGKGFAAYVVPPATPDGLFNVRVGSYGARPDAERISTRLRDQEKFKPFIVKNGALRPAPKTPALAPGEARRSLGPSSSPPPVEWAFEPRSGVRTEMGRSTEK